MSVEKQQLTQHETDRYEASRLLTYADMIKDGGVIVSGALQVSERQLEELYKENARRSEAQKTAEKPTKVASFKTERGSVYTYDPEGKSTRFKTATGKQKERTDLTVFAGLTPEQEGAFHDAVYAESSDPELRRTVQVLEQQPDNTGRFIRDISEVNDPDKLLLAIIQRGKVTGYVPASLVPAVGATVFERRNVEQNGQRFTERHMGHKVTEITYAE